MNAGECCCVPGCREESDIGLALDGEVFACCLAHADETMYRLSLTEPEGLSGYLSWRAEVQRRGAILPPVRLTPPLGFVSGETDQP